MDLDSRHQKVAKISSYERELLRAKAGIPMLLATELAVEFLLESSLE